MPELGLLPLPGSPWFQGMGVPPVETPPIPVPTYGIEFGGGPPIPGAPWLRGVPAVPPQAAPASAVVPPAPARPLSQVPFIARDPDMDRRYGRFTEQVSSWLNSLSAQGYIQLTGINTYKMLTGALLGNGPPTVNTDTTAGAVVGCPYVDLGTLNIWFCTQNTFGAAIWRAMTPSQSIPAGGTISQVLAKINSTDFNVIWTTRYGSLVGTGAPSAGLGVAGDTYIDTDTGNFYWRT